MQVGVTLFMEEEGLTPDELLASRNYVLTLMADSVSNLLYYDRKDDDELPLGRVELLVERGVLNAEEIAEAFRSALLKALSP